MLRSIFFPVGLLLGLLLLLLVHAHVVVNAFTLTTPSITRPRASSSVNSNSIARSSINRSTPRSNSGRDNGRDNGSRHASSKPFVSSFQQTALFAKNSSKNSSNSNKKKKNRSNSNSNSNKKQRAKNANNGIASASVGNDSDIDIDIDSDIDSDIDIDIDIGSVAAKNSEITASPVQTDSDSSANVNNITNDEIEKEIEIDARVDEEQDDDNDNVNDNDNDNIQKESSSLSSTTTTATTTTTTTATSPSTLTSLPTTTTTTAMSPTSQIMNDVESMYDDLDNGHCFSTMDYYSAKVQFKYTSPSKSFEQQLSTTTSRSSSSDIQDLFQQIQSHSQQQSPQSQLKPILIYLPGLDGVGISATTQFQDMASTFEFWRMYISDNRDTTTTYTQLIDIITSFIQDVAIRNNRRFILVGESFGGLLVPTVTLKLQNSSSSSSSSSIKELLQGIVLVNPATSFDQTQWSTFVPLLTSLRHIEQDELHQQQQQKSSSSSSSSSFASPFNSLLPKLPTPYSVLGGLALAATVPDSTQFQSILNIVTQTKVQTQDELSDVLRTMRDGFGILADKLPADVMDHRVNGWLNVGCMVLNQGKRLEEIQVETLVICGEDDNMLPTKREAERLVQTIPNCTSVTVKGSGHFVLDDRFNLTKAILDAPFYQPKVANNDDDMTIAAATTTKKYDPIVDWKLPSSEIVQDTIKNRVQPLRTLASPVFFSTGTDGLRRRGLGFVPSTSERNDNIRRYDNNDDDKATSTKKPLLFVANHQLFGLDLGMIIAQLVEERGISARGLAHPIIFQGGGMTGSIEDNPRDTTNGNNKKSRIEKRDRNGIIKDNNDDNGSTPNDTFQNFGAVMVTPRNFYRLMQTGQTGLLFPGGVREVFHGKDEAYELFWPEKVDFVRVAARFNATIVPISAVGAADSANILIDAPDMLKLPFGLGANLANSTKNVISARFDANDSEELFQPPFIVPKALPSRHYFVFGKPFDTSLIEHKNKEECSSIYQEVKTELRRGLDDLLVAREKDPFQNTAQRLVYERVYGKQAPTFSLNELNK